MQCYGGGAAAPPSYHGCEGQEKRIASLAGVP